MASTSSQTPSSSTSLSITPISWDVFLSFRGKDTRHGFTSHLYSALDRYNIRTFRDDPALTCGDHISDTLLQAIQESKIYIVVLSENYASSSWCLDELVEILSCSKTMQRSVIPVFYNILPSVVRYQTGTFKEDFCKHEDRLESEMEKIRKWKLTLKQVADISGKHIDGKRSEAVIVNEIVQEILLQINPTALYVAKYPVGLDSRVKDITDLLNCDTKGVIKIGIYGMGGVGKTTLAKELFNQLLRGDFKGSCFLANVREKVGILKDLVSLQQQLINDVLKNKDNIKVSSVGQGIKLIEARICLTKILVVIDDLGDHKEFESLVGPFACGSVVIITTRDEETLDNIEVETKYRYKVSELGYAESRTLLFRHAFGDTKPSNNLMILSNDILRLAGGLPLALVIFGSYLYKKTEVRWKSYIETLQRIPNSTIQQRLMISLEALELDDPLLKKMFLDIACFFIGRKRKLVVDILETFYPYADDKISILMKKCLITINSHNEFRMHDLLQEMGKAIVCSNSPDEPGKRSRLWVPEEIFSVLEEHKGTEAVECIMPHDFELEKGIMPHSFELERIFMLSFQDEDSLQKVSFATETLRRMSKLRFLYFDKINLTGKFERTLEDLRWFRWGRCPLKCLPFDFFPKKLVVLELPCSRMTTLWEVNRVSNAFEKLKTLNMSFSEDLTTTPDFGRLPCLQNLYLEGCISLKEVHISIGSLVSLVSLNLKGCENLRSLPDTICNSRALEVLCIEECTRLEALPVKLGNIKSLTELNACRISVPRLPDSIGYLSKLVMLRLDHNYKLEYLPSTICNLRELEVLSISHCTNLEALPVELRKLESLRELNAETIGVLKLPDSIGYLSKLVKLRLDQNYKLEYLPNTICNLRALEVLSINDCTNVEALPVELGNMESLRELKARGITISKLPDSICNIGSLEILWIEDCNKLESLPDQLWKLTRLSSLDVRGATLLKELPNIDSSQTSLSLTSMDLSETKITALPSGISQLSNLEELFLRDCGHLLSIAELPPNLTYFYAHNCTCLERLNLSNAKLLQKLNLTDCSALTEILGLGELTSIIQIYLEGCHSSLPACTLTEPLFQIYSGFEQKVLICLEAEKFPDWLIKSSVERSADDDLTEDISDRYVNLQPSLSCNYLGMILCFEISSLNNGRDIVPQYSVMSSASNIVRSWNGHKMIHGSYMVMIPRSIFRVTETDHTIKFTSNARRHWIHLLYKNEDDSATVNVEDERDLSACDFRVEEGGYPSKRLKLLDCDKSGSLEMVDP
ncbi:TMV resistance protein N-like [Apium graveolens]|uniref:TMV resistance protein N-like n=1 Tax=Apium graveolens TaxID=4045 RepID=UPI003D7A6300